MATRQDQILRFGVEVASDPGLLKVATDLEAITKAGGEAAPAAQALLDQLRKLAEQNATAGGLPAMKAELVELGDAFTTARLKVEQLEAQFDASDAPSARLTAQLEKARASVAGLQAQFNQQQASVTAAENALAGAGISTENLDASQRALRASLAATAAEGGILAASFKESSAAAKEQAASFSEVTEKSGFLRGAIEQISGLLKVFVGFFVLEKVKEDILGVMATGDKFAKFGVDFANAFGSAEKGREAFARVKELAETVPLSLEQVAAAAIKARKEGLDPFDGTLLALIDTNAKFGGSVDNLNVLIDVLGKATARGELTTRNLVALQQQGIPVTKILGEAMGKTADQILDLAKKGELGRDSIKLLVDTLGQGAAGDASKQMNLLGTLVVKVKDQWEEFLNLIANSGAYDFVRDKLIAINEAFKQGLADGSLREKAQSLSNAIVAIGNAVAGSIRFISDHAAAIYDAAKAYVIFKATILALDLASVSAKFIGLTAAVKESAAAAEGAAVANGGFSKLGAAIKSIPTAVKIAFATVALDFAITQTEKLYDTLVLIHEQNKKDEEDLKDLIAGREQLAAKADKVARALKGFADTQIADADKLASMSRQQSEDYLAQLQNATRYFTALRIQADQTGNFKGAQEATTRLRELRLPRRPHRKRSRKHCTMPARPSRPSSTVSMI
jgi:tape measure domain-containing protein